MLKLRIPTIVILLMILLCSIQHAAAGIKVASGDIPVYVSGHVMGGQVVRHANGLHSMNGVITGFAANQFPVEVIFKTMTSFVATARFQPAICSIVLADDTGKKTISRYDFNLTFERPGTTSVMIVDWKVKFPAEGFYAFNVFIDGVLVGYNPFYVWTDGMVIK
ncbi:MAG: hypothetical protein N2491_06230 [Negativicutes bacterium]|nr:hypothetical protein [Negativicutes bacterium]